MHGFKYIMPCMNYQNIISDANNEALKNTGNIFEEVTGLTKNCFVNEKYAGYVKTVALYILTLKEYYDLCSRGDFALLPIEEMQKWNTRLFSPVYKDNYDTCYANPEYAVKVLGSEGLYLSDIYARLLSSVRCAAAKEYAVLLDDVKLFTNAVEILKSGDDKEFSLKSLVKNESMSSLALKRRLYVSSMVDPEYKHFTSVIKNADLTDLRYLYTFGLHVTDNELDTARFINSLTEEEVKSMADTFTNGFLTGYAKLGVDIHKKASVSVYHVLGFERMIRYVMQNMEREGLKIVLSYAVTSNANRQFNYDYKNAMAAYLDEEYVENYIELTRRAFEEQKEAANGFAGPLALETFGEKEFQPVNKKESYSYTAEQQKFLVELQNKSAAVRSQYIIPEERSFAIISYPVPDIGDNFKEVFAATVKVNTLDYKTYETIQQKLIDALDQADTVHVKGLGDNRTDLVINICKLNDPSKESAFENCVADVNIPVGEVFTSPVLKGTNGLLNVKKVYLNGMLVKDLEIVLKDGMIEKCVCKNFDSEEDSRKYLDDIIMFHHDTLPIGEFAIGTNTTAYKMGIDYNVQDKLPILIAEKTGPHFAMGDTCYSRSEDIKVFNPDGKEIIAKENEVSALRKTNPDAAYFNCHTDITIPYNELDTIDAVKKNGDVIRLIDKGRFVLEGTEELNKPLIELYGN